MPATSLKNTAGRETSHMYEFLTRHSSSCHEQDSVLLKANSKEVTTIPRNP